MVYSAYCTTMYYRISVWLFCGHRDSTRYLLVGRIIATYTGCAGCRRVERTVYCLGEIDVILRTIYLVPGIYIWYFAIVIQEQRPSMCTFCHCSPFMYSRQRALSTNSIDRRLEAEDLTLPVGGDPLGRKGKRR